MISGDKVSKEEKNFIEFVSDFIFTNSSGNLNLTTTVG